jgi:hypothetical protein
VERSAEIIGDNLTNGEIRFGSGIAKIWSLQLLATYSANSDVSFIWVCPVH